MKISVLTPVYGSPRTGFVRSLSDLMIHTARARPEIELRYRLAEGHLTQNRNALAAAALEWGSDLSLCIDADMTFAADGLLRLLERKVAVVGANYPTRAHPPIPTADRDGRPIYTAPGSSGLEEADHMGLGFVLLETRLFGEVGDPCFRSNPEATGWPGEDVDFFRRVRALGVPLYVDHDVSQQVGHVSEHIYTNAIAAHFGQAATRPKAVIGS
jgi:hypothetical protein